MLQKVQINQLLSWLLIAMLTVLGVGAGRAWAQGATATILGTVTDMSGAAVPDAMVQVKNTGTGATQSVAADAQGRFRVPDLGIGDYEVQAAKTGFSTMVHKGITLAVGAQTVVDFALPVGQQQQTVTVEGEALGGGNHQRRHRHLYLRTADARASAEWPQL